jgi:hypothetical protein
MALSATSFLTPQFQDYKFYWLKFYLPGGTTPKSMATDATGDTLIAKAQVKNRGFFETAGGTIFIPFVDGLYDAYLFPTEAEADANDTSSAIRVADNVTGAFPASFDSVQLSFNSFDLMKASTVLSSFNMVSTRGYYSTSVGIGAADYVKTTVTGTPGDTDGGGYFVATDGVRWDILTGGEVSYTQFGADSTGVADSWLSAFNCHAYANLKVIPVRQSFGTFYLAARATSPYSIAVKTNWDMVGANIVLRAGSGYPSADFRYLFEIESYTTPVVLGAADLTELNTTFAYLLKKDSTKLPTSIFSAYKNAGVRLDGQADITRSTGVVLNKIELLVIADNGGLQTPIAKDFSDGLTACTIYPQDDFRLVINSPAWILDGVADVRALVIRNRHNVTLQNSIVKEIVDQPVTTFSRTFFAAIGSYDIEWNNIRGEAWTQTTVPEGLYLFGGNVGANWRYINCVGTHGWGASGLNYLKNVTFRECSLNRYDIHWAGFDITLENCDLHNWGALMSGGNQLTIKKCRYFLANSSSVVGDSPQYSIVQTRIDYGSEWDGDILVDGLEIIIGADFTDSFSKDLSVVKFPFTGGNTDYGRATILGRSVTVKNVTIQLDDPTRYATIDKDWIMVNYEFGENTNNDYYIAHTINVEDCGFSKPISGMAILAYLPPKHYGARIKALYNATDVSDGDYNQIVNIKNINNCINLRTSVPNTTLEIVKFGGDLAMADAGWATRVDALRPQINIDNCNGVAAAIAVNGNVNITDSEVLILDDVANTRPTELYVRLSNCRVRMLDNGSADYLLPMNLNIDDSLFYKSRTAAAAVHTLDFTKWSATSGYQAVSGSGNKKVTGFLSSNDPTNFFGIEVGNSMFITKTMGTNLTVASGTSGTLITLTPPSGQRAMLEFLVTSAFPGEPAITVNSGVNVLISGGTLDDNAGALDPGAFSVGVRSGAAGDRGPIFGEIDEVITVVKDAGSTATALNYSFRYGI